MVPASRSEFDASPTSPKTYKDNAFNQKCGRVGMPIGSAVIQKEPCINHTIHNTASNHFGMFHASRSEFDASRWFGRSSIFYNNISRSAIAEGLTHPEPFPQKNIDQEDAPMDTSTPENVHSVPNLTLGHKHILTGDQHHPVDSWSTYGNDYGTNQPFKEYVENVVNPALLQYLSTSKKFSSDNYGHFHQKLQYQDPTIESNIVPLLNGSMASPFPQNECVNDCGNSQPFKAYVENVVNPTLLQSLLTSKPINADRLTNCSDLASACNESLFSDEASNGPSITCVEDSRNDVTDHVGISHWIDAPSNIPNCMADSGCDGSLNIHYATHDTRLTHGHRKLRPVEDFEMLRLTPDFETLCLMHDFETLRLTPDRCQPDVSSQNQASDAGFHNHASDVIFCDHASDVQYESGHTSDGDSEESSMGLSKANIQALVNTSQDWSPDHSVVSDGNISDSRRPQPTHILKDSQLPYISKSPQPTYNSKNSQTTHLSKGHQPTNIPNRPGSAHVSKNFQTAKAPKASKHGPHYVQVSKGSKPGLNYPQVFSSYKPKNVSQTSQLAPRGRANLFLILPNGVFNISGI